MVIHAIMQEYRAAGRIFNMKIVTKQKSRGQTLVEALVTLLFIAVGVIALIRFQNYLAYDNSLSRQKADATAIAQSRMEVLRDYQVLNNTAGYTSYESISSGNTTVTGTTATYTVVWTVATNTNPDYKDVTVTVSWTDRNGVSQSVVLNSRIAGIEPANSAAVM